MIRRAALAFVLLTAACATPRNHAPVMPVTVGVLAFNDFHGHIEAHRAAQAGETGGAALLAGALATARARFPYSATVSAGDLIGASPLASSLFLDEPTITAMNMLGLDFDALGNHEFDRGRAELLRMQQGGCEKHTLRQPCAVEAFAGARFRFLSASTTTETGDTLFPATGIRHFGNGASSVSVGFIGLTLRATPTLVSPDGISGLTFGDEAAAINAAVPVLKRQGADAVVVLIHQGGATADPADANGCEALSGDILPIVEKLDPRVDAVVSGHTHKAYVCELDRGGDRPLLLTSAGNYGRLLTEIALAIDPVAGRVVAGRAVNVPIDSASFSADPAVAAFVERYAEATRAVGLRPVGRLSGLAARGEPIAQDLATGGALGNLVADAQLAATRGAGAQIALTNPLGLRAALQPGADGAVTFAQIYAAQPFGNVLVTQSLTGAQIRAAIGQGLDAEGPRQVLAASSGLRIVIAQGRVGAITLDGRALEDGRTYRVTTNSFLASGGDGIAALAQGREHVLGGSDLDALEAWIGQVPVRHVPEERRVEADPR